MANAQGGIHIPLGGMEAMKLRKFILQPDQVKLNRNRYSGCFSR